MTSNLERRLSAIMFTDIVGFTRIMGDDESTALTILENQESLITPIISSHNGNIIKKTGDGYLLEFSSSVESVECAIKMQDSIKTHNSNENNLEFHIRIGIHLGDIVVVGDDILGDGVNIASRIEPLAKPDGICLTEVVYASVKSKLSIQPKRIDQVELKHIDDKYTIYKLPDTEEETDLDSIGEFPNEENHPEIKISSFKLISKLHKEFIKSFSNGFIAGIYLPFLFQVFDLMIYTFYDLLIKGDSTFFYQQFRFFPTTLTEPEWALFLSFADGGFKSFLFMCAFFTIVYGIGFRKKEEKFVFNDIRNIDKLLDEIVTGHVSYAGGHYEIIEKDKNSITYYPYSSNSSKFFGKIEKQLNRIVPIMVKIESLTLRFDGNVVTIRGMWFSVNKFKKQLKFMEKFI